MESTRNNSGEMDLSQAGNLTLEEMREILLNITQNLSNSKYQDILKEEPWRTVIIVIYIIVILGGFMENASVIGIFIKNKHLHVPTNFFIAVLAMSDMFLCSFNLPLQLHQQLTDTWIYGETMCKILVPSYGIPVFMSSMSILLIAVDRYVLIVHPFRPRMSIKTAVTLILGIALLSLLIIIPMVIQMELIVIELPLLGLHKKICAEKWKDIDLRHAYTIATIVIQFLVPLFATSFLYIRTGLALTRNKFSKDNKLRQKVNNILIAIVVSFSICWLPRNLFSLLLEFNQVLVPYRYFYLTDCILKIVAMASACINPFFYGWLNKNFRP